MRTSHYREHILSALRQHHTLSLQQLSEIIPDADFSTVYRNVESLCATNTVKPIVIDSKRVVYELASHHHDHSVCTTCGDISVVSIKQSLLQNNLATIHDILVRGTCNKCSSNTSD